MKGYIYTIIVISVIGGIVTSIVSNKDSGLKKHVSLVVGLVCAIVFISPIVSIANNSVIIKNSINNVISGLDIENSIDKSNQIIVSTSIDNICQGVKEAVVSEFKLKDSDVEVSAIVDSENMQAIVIDEIKIVLLNEASWYDADKVKEYIADLVGCNVSVTKR